MLSKNRAETIRKALIENGVPADNLKSIGYGRRIANAPVFSSENVREGDRRVTIEMITNNGYWDILK